MLPKYALPVKDQCNLMRVLPPLKQSVTVNLPIADPAQHMYAMRDSI